MVGSRASWRVMRILERLLVIIAIIYNRTVTRMYNDRQDDVLHVQCDVMEKLSVNNKSFSTHFCTYVDLYDLSKYSSTQISN